MSSLLEAHDYILFLQGFAALCLGMLSLLLTMKSERTCVSFAAYAMLQGLALWMGIYASSLPGLEVVKDIRCLLFCVSCAFLAEYSASVLKPGWRFFKGGRILALCLLGCMVAALSCKGGLIGGGVIQALGAGLLALSTLPLWSESRRSSDGESKFWTAAGLCHAAYGSFCIFIPAETLRIGGGFGGGAFGIAALALLVGMCACFRMLSRMKARQKGIADFAPNSGTVSMVSCLALAFIAWAPPYKLRDYAQEEQLTECILKTDFIDKALKAKIGKGGEFASLMASSVWAKDFFERPSEETRTSVRVAFARYSASVADAVFYLLDTKGRCVLASNYNLTDSFEGKNFSFRPYFKDAVSEGKGLYFALGSVSKKPGIYVSRTVRDEFGSMLGVAVVKQNMDVMPGAYKSDTVALLSPEGIVFSSNRSELDIGVAKPLEPVQESAIIASRQFGPGPFRHVNIPSFCGDKNCHGTSLVEGSVLWMHAPLSSMPGWTVAIGSSSGQLLWLWLSGFGISMLIVALHVSYMGFRSFQRVNAARIAGHLAWKSAVLDNSAAGIVILDESRRVVEMNSAAEGLFGYSADELKGSTTERLYLSKDAYESFGRELYAAIISDGRIVMEIPLRRKDGKSIWCRVSGKALHSGDLSKGSVWVLADETEKRNSLDRLKESEDLYRSLVQSSSDHIFMLDSDGRFIASNNPKASAMIASGGLRIGRLFNRKDAVSRYKSMLKNVFSLKRPVSFQHLSDEADGMHNYMDTLFPILKDGDVVAVGGISKDITQMKRAEESLRRSERRFKDIAQSASDMIWELDSEGRLSYCSENAEDILGYTPQELIGRTPFEFLSDEDSAKAKRSFELLRKEPHPFKGVEAKCSAKGGSLLWLSSSGVPVFDDSGVFSGCRGTIADITKDRQDAERLRNAYEQAEAATKAKSDFIAVMSHEIRTPLNGMMGMAELLMRTKLDPEQRSFVAAIESSGEHLALMLNDILDLSKIEAGKESLDIAPCDLRAICNEAVAMLSPRALEKGIRLNLSIAQSIPDHIMADSRKLKQILINLIGNSVKFTNEGSVSLSVEPVEPDESSNARLLFLISDTGVGIPKELQESLFEKFRQIDGSGDAKYVGSGLGLSITRALVELMGGRISLESELAKGTRISFTLSFRAGKFEREPESVIQGQRGPEASTFSGMVMLVEDNQINRMVAVRFLESSGCEVAYAPNGEEALKLFKESKFSLILLDLHLPGLDGYQVAQAMRAFEAEGSAPRTPIVALTANVMGDGGAERCYEAGMDSFLGKPLKGVALRKELAKWLQKSNGKS